MRRRPGPLPPPGLDLHPTVALYCCESIISCESQRIERIERIEDGNNKV